MISHPFLNKTYKGMALIVMRRQVEFSVSVLIFVVLKIPIWLVQYLLCKLFFWLSLCLLHTSAFVYNSREKWVVWSRLCCLVSYSMPLKVTILGCCNFLVLFCVYPAKRPVLYFFMLIDICYSTFSNILPISSFMPFFLKKRSSGETIFCKLLSVNFPFVIHLHHTLCISF